LEGSNAVTFEAGTLGSVVTDELHDEQIDIAEPAGRETERRRATVGGSLHDATRIPEALV